MLNQDFKEFIKSLNDNQVRYMVVGGYAVAMHGHPRYTKDLDVWLELNPGNAAQIIKALAQFGFSSLSLREEDFLDAAQVVQLGYPPNRIDLILSLKGVDFECCYESRLQIPIAGVTVDFIDLENLKKNKKAVGLLQDLADLEQLGGG